MRRYILLIALLGLLSFSPAEAFSQAIYGSIFGTIIDPSGTSIPNAKVTVINLSKGTRTETTSNATGNYSIIHLIPDAYALRITASGFKVLQWKSITVAADNEDPILGIIVINPNLDSIAEVKWTLQNYDAEFGKAIAGIMAAQTRSGGNTLHGSGFWFRRSDATQARDPFTQFQKDSVTGRFIPSTMWNQFGGSLGGPLIKNKLFFFGDYQGTRRKTGFSVKTTVPTQLVHDTC